MFFNNAPVKDEESLDSILRVFTETKDKLVKFVDVKTSKKETLEKELADISADITRSKDVLGNINKILA